MTGQDDGGSGQPPSRINLSTSATDRLQKSSVSSILTEAFSGGHDWVSLARIIAGQLRSPGLDWRDLARGLEQVRQRGTISGANQLLDRVAILAMHLAAPGEEHIVQSASAEMLEACGPGCGPECMLRAVLPILRNLVPFDVATYAEYHYRSDKPEDPVLVQARFAIDGDDEFQWPARWIEVPSSLIAWAAGKQRWIVDIDDFFKERADAAALREHPVMHEYTKRQITSFVVVRYMDGERLTATLTLGRRRGEAMQPFSRSDQNRLDALRLEAVLRRVGDGFEARTTALRQQIGALFHRGADPVTVARETVQLLGTTYGWEYVAVFRVNRARGLFEVVAEHDPTGQLSVGLKYTQALDAGMLGAVLRRGEPLSADNVRTHPPPFGYISSRDAQKSAMCFPVRIRHDVNRGPQSPGTEPDPEIEWILDLESSQIGGFFPPDQAALQGIIDDIERTLSLWFEARLNAALLALIGEGVVVLGQGGMIERANPGARRLLGLSPDIPLPLEGPFRMLASFAGDDETSSLLTADPAPAFGERLTLRGPGGVPRRAIGGAVHGDDAFHRWIWIIADLAQSEWIGGLEYMQTAVSSIAAQSRGRLLLANALVRRAERTLPTGAQERPLLDRAMRNFAAADITYERIASYHDVLREPRRAESALDVAAELRRFRASLPQEDIEALTITGPEQGCVVRGDPERLGFALRSLLGLLLSVRAPEDKVVVTISAAADQMTIRCGVAGQQSLARARTVIDTRGRSDGDALAEAESRAIAAAMHGLDAVEAIIRAHGGRLAVSTGATPDALVAIHDLPIAQRTVVVKGLASPDLAAKGATP